MPTTHTPGPWKHREPQMWGEAISIATRGRIYGDGLLVATLDPPQLKEEVAMKAANARLIAAAPELLDMLKMLYKNRKELPTEFQWQRAGELIAKATGGAA